MSYKMKKISKQFLAILLSITLVFSCDPLTNATATNSSSNISADQTAQSDTKSGDSLSEKQSDSADATVKGENPSDDAGEQEATTNENEANDDGKTSTSSDDVKLAATSKADGLVGDEGSSENAVTETSTCKIVRGSETLYFDTLAEAVAGSEDGEEIEIFKSHTLSSEIDSTSKNLTIKNITESASDDENPTKNGSADEAPVVTFEAGASFSVNSNVSLSGVIFEGTSAERSKPFASVESGFVLTVDDGVAGTLEATNTEIKNFNVTQAGTSGGAFCIRGSVIFNSGTVSNCHTKAGDGGAVAFVDGGVFTLNGGTISGNGDETGVSGSGVFSCKAATLNVLGGTISGNSGVKGGVIYSQGSSNTILISGGEIKNNSSSQGGGAIYSEGGALSVSGGTICDNSTSEKGGAVYAESGTLTIVGGTISGNFATSGGGAIAFASANVEVSGGSISGNACTATGDTASAGAAVEHTSSSDAGTLILSGSPVIYGNGMAASKETKDAIVTKANVNLTNASHFLVGELAQGAKVGFYNEGTLCDGGVQFAVAASGDASTTKFLSNTFSNDKNQQYAATAGDGAVIKWTEPVCKILREGEAVYYESLTKAIEGALTGETIEILKSHTVTAVMDTKDKDLTIQNVNNPLNDAEDPNKNGSDDATPVVTFGAAAKIAVNSNVSLVGVVFDGTGTNTRVIPSATVAAGYTLNISDGVAGTIAATSTVIKDFYNNNTGGNTTTGGGFVAVYGIVNMDGGTISGCKAYSYQFSKGGGSVASLLSANAQFNLSGGTLTENGTGAIDSAWGNSTITLWAGTFTMTGGTVSKNSVRTGGCVGVPDNCNTTVNLLGGEILENTSSGQGGAVYFGPKGTSTINIGGDVKIKGNTATIGTAICGSAGTAGKVTFNISGTPEISGNTGKTNGVTGAALEGYSYGDNIVMNISGSPVIYGNKNSSNAAADINPGTVAKLQIGDMGENAKIGYYSNTAALVTNGNQFGTATKNPASGCKNVGGAFINDKDTSIISVASTSNNQVKWVKAVCKIQRTDNAIYYDSLSAAITGANSGSGGETIEIFKSHSMAATVSATKAVTIKNITDPKNDAENPNENGSTDAVPVVTFTAAGRVTVGANVGLEGVVFNGNSTNRTSSGFLINAGSTLTIEDGVDGALAKTETVLKNFVNTSTTNAAGGGLFLVNGTVTLTSGTISGCKAAESSTCAEGGGAVAFINAGGLFTIEGGTVKENGVYKTGYSNQTPFYGNGGTITMTGGTVRDNNACMGGFAMLRVTSTINVSGGEITSNRSGSGGGAIALCASTNTLNLSGDAKITNNFTTQDGAAITLRNTSTINISGSPQITGNTSLGGVNVGAGIETDAYTAEASQVINISGSPIIKDNGKVAAEGGAITTKANINLGSAVRLQVSDLDEGAEIGYYNSETLCNTGVQFAVGTKNANKITNLTASFVNDRNSTLKALSGGGTKIVWGIPSCKLVSADNESHYATLDAAITDATADATDEHIEIYRSHTMTATADTTSKNLTIMNIVDPANDDENPTLNGSADTQPVVHFSDGTTKGRILVNSDIVLNGVIFDGAKADGTSVSRTNSGFLINAGYSLTINDGEAGELDATETVIKNFYNTSTTSATSGGGFAFVYGTLTLNSGTITGCNALASQWSGGGAVAVVYTPGVFNINGGLIDNNGSYGGVTEYCRTPVYVVGGKVNMTAGQVSNNKARSGGFIFVPDTTSLPAPPAECVDVSGGVICNNSANYEGGAFFISRTTTLVLRGNAIVMNNHADRYGSAVLLRLDTSGVLVKDNAVITKNTCTYAGASTCAGAISTPGNGYTCKVTVEGNPIIYDNTDGASHQANINLNKSAELSVGNLGPSALIGYWSNNGTQAKGATFGTGQAQASTLTHLSAFVNDVYPAYLGSAGTGTAVVWPAAENAYVKMKETRTINGEVMTFTHPFATIGEAVECANDLSAENMVDGKFTFELLTASMDQDESVSINTGETKPLLMTTASSTATDGYPYRGTAGTPAIVKRAFDGDSMFIIEDGDDATHTTLTCTDVTIDGNKANYSCASKGGAFSVAQGNALTLEGATTLQNNKSAVSGGALYANAANVTIKGDTKIQSNTAPEFSAVEIDGDMSLYLEGNATISENVNTSDVSTGAVGRDDVSSMLVLSGNLTIYDNKSSDDKQQNVFDDTALNDGTFLKIADAGISEDSKIGVWSENNYIATNTFARTENASSEEVENLSCFVNDKISRLTGYAGDDNRVIWSSLEPVTLKKTLSASQEDDVWFVVQIKNVETNEVYRQAIRVEQGTTSGEATVLLRSGVTYAFDNEQEQGTWRFSHDATTPSSFATTDVWTEVAGSVGTLKIMPPDDEDYERLLTLSTTSTHDEYVSDTRSVVNTIKVN